MGDMDQLDITNVERKNEKTTNKENFTCEDTEPLETRNKENLMADESENKEIYTKEKLRQESKESDTAEVASPVSITV